MADNGIPPKLTGAPARKNTPPADPNPTTKQAAAVRPTSANDPSVAKRDWQNKPPLVAEKLAAAAMNQKLIALGSGIDELTASLVANGPDAIRQAIKTHTHYLLGERPTDRAQAQLYDAARKVMELNSSRQLDVTILNEIGKATALVAKNPQLAHLGGPLLQNAAASLKPLTPQESTELLSVAKAAAGAGNQRLATGVAAYLGQVALPEVLPADAILAVAQSDLFGHSLLAAVTVRHFLPSEQLRTVEETAHAFVPPLPKGASAQVQAIYQEAFETVKAVLTANNKKFNGAIAAGDIALQRPQVSEVNRPALEAVAGFVEKAREAGLVELEYSLSGNIKGLFPGLANNPAQLKPEVKAAFERIRGAKLHLGGGNASMLERTNAGIALVMGPRPGDPANRTLWDGANAIATKRFTTIQGNTAMADAAGYAGVPPAELHYRTSGTIGTTDSKSLLAFAGFVDSAHKSGNSKLAVGMAVMGLQAFPSALTSPDAAVQTAAERMVTIWDGAPIGQEAIAPLIGKMTAAEAQFVKLDAEQEKVLRKLKDDSQAELASARKQGRLPELGVLRKLSQQANATQQHFLGLADGVFAKVLTPVERDQYLSVASLLGEQLKAVIENPTSRTRVRESMFGHGQAMKTLFDEALAQETRKQRIAALIEDVRRPLDAAPPRLTAAGSSLSQRPAR